MNDLQKYQPETRPYQFPTQLPATPGGLTPQQLQQIEIEFQHQPAFWKRKAVAAFVVAPLIVCAVAKVVLVGVTAAEFATCAGVAFVAWVLRPATGRGTAQRYADTPDKWPATVSGETPSKVSNITIVNNITVNQ